jgi:hypothetical protein
VAETELNLVITQEPSAEHNEFCMVWKKIYEFRK